MNAEMTNALRNHALADRARTAKPLRLDPPASEAELDHAAEIWTAAQDVMVARGFTRLLWGSGTAAQHEFVVLMLRAEKSCQLPALDTPFLFPLFAHMQREHGLTLVDSELEEILHVCRRLDSIAAEQANTRDDRRGTINPSQRAGAGSAFGVVAG